MANDVLHLLLPQWQGSGDGNKRLYHSATALGRALRPEWSFETLDVPADEPLEIEHDILAYTSVIAYLEKTRALIEAKQPSKLMVVGGDCSVDLAPIAYLNQTYQGDLVIVWLDAHGDLNTPSSSPSKRFHGMPLRHLLGEGDSEVLRVLNTVLGYDQAVLGGVRDMDPEEEGIISDNHIPLLSVETLTKDPSVIVKAIQKTGKNHVHVHVDLDVLDPTEFSSVMCLTPGGLSQSTLSTLLDLIGKSHSIVGCTLTEYSSPHTDELAVVLAYLKQMKSMLES